MLDSIRKGAFLFLSILSMALFAVFLSYSHIGVSWLWLWPLFSVFCLARFAMLHFKFKPPKAIRIIYYTLAAVGIGFFIITEGQIIAAMNSAPETGLDYIITLGAAVRNSTPTTPLRLRIDRSAEYLLQNPDTLVIASGGQGAGEDISEAECIKRELVSRGIDESRIILEDKSRDTEQNIKYSFDNIPAGSSVGVVTNSFHIYRAVLAAKYAGHEVSGVPAKTYLPLGIHYTVREFFAVTELEMKNLF